MAILKATKMFQKLAAVLLLSSWSVFIMTKNASARNISIVGDQFMLDGKPLQILSGSVHYFRMPSEYWRDRLLKAKAAGLNAIASYVEWSFHEPEERQYRFDGDYDLVKFVRTATEVGLLVLMRVGPYICAERDLGGLPYWLFTKYPKIKLRTTDKDFMAETKTWLAKLFEKLSPLLYGNGGPIILVQIENEYGSFHSDLNYKLQLRDIFEEHVGSNALLYTTDGDGEGYLKGGKIPGSLPTIDFGPGYGIKKAFDPLRKVMPKGPLQNSEFYTGWLTHWGEKFSITPIHPFIDNLEYMMKHGNNVNMYVFYGGTNFGFSSGANTEYKPSVTSYDYDAPVSEAGDLTQKYWAIRNLTIKYHPEVKNITPPAPAKKGAYGKVSVGNGLGLLSPEGRSIMGVIYGAFAGDQLPTFEQMRQQAGLMLYETTLNYTEGILLIQDPRDRVYVFVDNKYMGLIDREKKVHRLTLKTKSKSRLSLLCENQGRINFQYFGDVKGIRHVKFNNTIVDGEWNITGYPLQNIDDVTSDENQQSAEYGPVMYDGMLTLSTGQEPLDTFIDTTGWGKGYMWVNGHNLGRYWPGRGPQISLYVPGVWLRRGRNRLQILELEEPRKDLTVNFLDHPIAHRFCGNITHKTTNGSWHGS